MAKKKYSTEFMLTRLLNHWVRISTLKRDNRLTGFCEKTFCRNFKIPLKMLTDRKHRVRITIEFLEELK